MKELSIFVDESGDFGPFQSHSPFYLFTLVFHDQDASVATQIEHLERELSPLTVSTNHCFHAGPIIRREEDYQNLSVRVSGWNARFVTLNREWQDMIIAQTGSEF